MGFVIKESDALFWVAYPCTAHTYYHIRQRIPTKTVAEDAWLCRLPLIVSVHDGYHQHMATRGPRAQSAKRCQSWRDHFSDGWDIDDTLCSWADGCGKFGAQTESTVGFGNCGAKNPTHSSLLYQCLASKTEPGRWFGRRPHSRIQIPRESDLSEAVGEVPRPALPEPTSRACLAASTFLVAKRTILAAQFPVDQFRMVLLGHGTSEH